MRTGGIDRFIARLRRSRYADVRWADPPRIEEVTIMSATITIPADLEQQMLGKAKANGQQLEEFALDALRKAVEAPSPAPSMNGVEDDTWLDVEYMAACGKEADPSITLESVRQILAKIPGSISDDIIAERDERF